MIGKFLKKIFGSRNSRIIKEYAVNIKAINDLESLYEKKSDEELKNITQGNAVKATSYTKTQEDIFKAILQGSKVLSTKP